MSIESKAKNPMQIAKEINRKWNEGWVDGDAFVAWTKQKEKELLIPLAAAQKTISELTTGYEFRLTEYEAKIEAAKPLLENCCKCCFEGDYESGCENDCYIHDLKALLIPRKEEGEK